MSEKPMILNTEMVKAVLSGNKICTRRPLKPQPVIGEDKLPEPDGYPWKPPCQKDDVLYVRETWLDNHEWCMINNGFLDTHESHILYKANDSDLKIATDREQKWKPSIHMPKYISRLSLKVTNVRVERVQDIRESEAKKEGVTVEIPEIYNAFQTPYRHTFAKLWNSIYKNWDSNPWVWVIDFEVVKL